MSIQDATIGAILGLVLGVTAGASVDHHFMQGKLDREVNKAVAIQAAVNAKAVVQQKAQSDLALKSAVTEASAQERIVTQTRTVIKEVPTYVTPAQDARGCVTYGLVRVLDAASQGVGPADLGLPAGQSDDACSPLKASDLAAGVAENFGIARQNAQQLDGLIADVRARVEAANAK